MKDYSHYYTPKSVSDVLVDFLVFNDNQTVIDICCGSCNLLLSAKHANQSIECLGVDISSTNNSWCKTIKEDGRLFSIKTQKRFDIALANPPFETVKNNSYSEKLFIGKYKDIKTKRLEVEMLIANLNLLKDSGTLLIIMPITFVYGSSFQRVRRIVSQHHYVKTIIELPDDTFSPEQICSCAIVIDKKPNKNGLPCTVYSVKNNNSVVYQKQIPYSQIYNGEWEEYQKSFTDDFKIKRGNISTNCFSKNGTLVLHTAKETKDWKPSKRYVPNNKINSSAVIAEEGDLIISRVGVSAGNICIYNGPQAYISDCLMIIKNPSNNMINIFSKMNMKSIVKGVSTPHITAVDIYKLYNASL